MNPNQLRQNMRQKRQALSLEEVANFSNQIAAFLLNSKYYQEAKHIACYLNIGNEVSCDCIIQQIAADNKHCYLPVIDPDQAGLMNFVSYSPGDVLQKNRFDILEPVNDQQTIAPKDLDLVLMPLVAYDQVGHRLGAGGGYYDRAFAGCSGEKPLLCGLAYQFQGSDQIEANEWDVDMHILINEEKILHFK